MADIADETVSTAVKALTSYNRITKVKIAMATLTLALSLARAIQEVRQQNLRQAEIDDLNDLINRTSD